MVRDAVAGHGRYRHLVETASRLRGRIEEVLDAAKAQGLRAGENPATWKGNLSHLLAKRNSKKRRHFPALPWPLMNEFMTELRKHQGTGPRALEFTILTAARSGEVREAVWREVDLGAQLWVVPGERMKMKDDHTKPLSDEAVKNLRALPQVEGTDLIFPNPRKKKPISDATMGKVGSDNHLGRPCCLTPSRKVIKDMNTAAGGKKWVDKKGDCATTHGFRSSFKDWSTECTDHSETVVEMALAHKVGSDVERAYRLGELLMKRTVLMKDWAQYCNTPASIGNVIPMAQKKGAT